MTTLAEKAEIALRIVREAKVFAYDTETSGLDWKRNSAIGYVLTEGETSVYVPVRHGGGGNLIDPNVAPLAEATSPTKTHRFEIELAKAFKERRGVAVMHNAQFDLHMSANHGVLLGRNCEDTMVNASLLDEYQRSYSLDNCAKIYQVTAKLGDELYKHMASKFGGEANKNQMGQFWRLGGTDPIAVEYAEGDGITTLELREVQHEQIEEQNLGPIHEIESQLIWTVFRMERRGIKIDTDRLAQIHDQLKQMIADARANFHTSFNVRSRTQVQKAMEQIGRTDWPQTALGNPSFPEKWLKGFEEGKAIIRIRRLSNLDNSFVRPLMETHIHQGRVHSHFNQMKSDQYGTISGRFSSSRPNLQQIPKRDKELSKLFRSAFIPDEGMDFYEADYSQCEPRLFAHYSKEPSLVAGYCSTPFRDMHAVVAEMFTVERDPTAKRMNMGILTGMQPKSFAGHMGWDVQYATEMWNKWFEGFPGIKDFQDQATDIMRQRGFVRTLLGRRGRMDNPRYAYRAVSKIIQGGNADIMKKKMLEIDLMLEEMEDIIHILCTVHDSLNWQAPATPEGREASKEIVRVMEDVQGPPFNLRVPFKVDVGSGPNWAVATWGSK